MRFLFGAKSTLPTPVQALPGRPDPIVQPGRHAVLGTSLAPPYPADAEVAEFALGCFWGAEKRFWQLPGVITTAAGYQGGLTPNPTYEEVCSGKTGHAEAVRVVFDPARISYEELLREFWEAHDPTQGMRQGNDVGTQYRSAVFVSSEAQREAARRTLESYQASLRDGGYGEITTEIADAGTFYFAEDYHQQYLQKNPFGYCPDHSTGISCSIAR
jgi:peptide-methionine (S)-S-oxide reductase